MGSLMVYLTLLYIIMVTRLSNAEQNTIALTQFKTETKTIELVGHAGKQLNSFFLLSPGFHAVLINSSDPAITMTRDGHIEFYSDNPGLHNFSILIQDDRNSTNSNISQSCSTLHLNINFNIMKNKSTGLCGKSPDLENPLDCISLTVGKLFRLKLNSDYFQDAEDGNTRQLSVTMTMGNGRPLPSGHWVQFDAYNQVIYGLAVGESEKTDEVLLVIAEDSCGQSTYDAVRVEVDSKSHSEFNSPTSGYLVEFSDIPVCPIEDLINLYLFVEDLMVWFNDSREIFITEKVNCSLRLLMVNKEEAISLYEKNNEEKRNVFDEKGEIATEFLCYFMPSFKITKFEPFVQNYSLGKADDESHFVPIRSDINHWLEIVLPVIILLSIFVLVIIILYLCHTRKKKLYILQSEKPTFLEERRPVIFQTEVPLEDSTLNPRTPVILSHDDEVPSSEVELLDQRSLPSTPDYTPPISQPPPSYRIPPPYTGSHQYW